MRNERAEVGRLRQENAALRARVEELEGVCPTCGHAWRRHDPEDGGCDAPTEEWHEDTGLECQCGRDIGLHCKANAARSRANLNAPGTEGRNG